MPRRRKPFIPTAATMTDAMLDHIRQDATDTQLPQTAFAWERGTAEGESCALVSAAAPAPSYLPADSIRPAGAVGQPLVTVLPATYYR